MAPLNHLIDPPNCDLYCKGEGVVVRCSEEYSDDEEKLICQRACMDCRPPAGRECYCPDVYTFKPTDETGGTGGTGGTHPPVVSPEPCKPPCPASTGPTTTENATIIVGKHKNEDVLGPLEPGFPEDHIIFIIIAFLILILLILLCLCWYWWRLKKGEQAVYETVTSVASTRASDMSPYVGYDYPKKRRRKHRKRRKEVEEEESVMDEEASLPIAQKPPPAAALPPCPLQPVPVEECCEDEDDECEDEDDDDCEQQGTMKIYYEMCLN